jgi:hypothetical protein
LHLDAVTRQPSLHAWVTTWHPSPNPRWLTPEHCFDIGQTHDQCIWTPPPAAADVAIELVAKAKHKRPSHFHVILVPRLLTSRWRKLMSKTMAPPWNTAPGIYPRQPAASAENYSSMGWGCSAPITPFHGGVGPAASKRGVVHVTRGKGCLSFLSTNLQMKMVMLR